MFLSCLALVVISSAAVAALPGHVHASGHDFNVDNGQYPLNTVEPYISDAKHPGHPFPDPPPFPPRPGRETIYSIFSRIVKAINYIDEVAALLNDSSVGVTFLAPSNKALHHPKKGKEQTQVSDERFGLRPLERTYDLGKILCRLEALDSERRRRFLEMLLRATLQYHILPRRLDVVALGDKTTHATHLTVHDALGGNPIRIRTEQKSIPPVLIINLYSHVVRPNLGASNGLIHVIDHPLFPPPSAFQELFMAPTHFSIFTSVIQRTGLTDALDFRYVPSDNESRTEGTPAVTVFAPTNKAFQSLPKDLQLFLFSPFGERVLRKLLQYHIVPDFVLHADHSFNHSSDQPSLISNRKMFDSDSEYAFQLDDEVRPGAGWIDLFKNNEIPQYNEQNTDINEGIEAHKHKKRKKPKHPKLPCPEPISLVDIILPTLYVDHPLHAHIGRFKVALPIPGDDHPYRVDTKFSVDGHKILVPDLVALNGAIHMIDVLLDPRGPRHDYETLTESHLACRRNEADIWESWQVWLRQWAGV
ncbi:hypothetical protein AX17_003352 [Amanita inopinata Kibby_2008]|nr:hypothetical protein AX17_003352 [Amanita inopinata Kibby_2008]